MTDKQKEAVKVLNKLRDWNLVNYSDKPKPILSEDDYMTLLDAIISGDSEPRFYTYINPSITPLDAYYDLNTTMTSRK